MMFIRLGYKRSPLEKLQCLKQVCQLINKAVEENLTSHYREIGAHQMTTDDMYVQSAGHVSEGITVSNAILAGCVQANEFARIKLYGLLEDLHYEIPTVQVR